jgi:hypothetical protein
MIKMENNKLEMEGHADDLLYEIEEILRGFIRCFEEEKMKKMAAILLLDTVRFAAIPDDKIRERIAMDGISELLKQAKEAGNGGNDHSDN